MNACPMASKVFLGTANVFQVLADLFLGQIPGDQLATFDRKVAKWMTELSEPTTTPSLQRMPAKTVIRGIRC
ncbi:hypothetical protein [Caldimonas sp. KR1-144]|uniref:hypothetical protein n=1 Tax=Caldimonas sp. KR1-144 TaxID=3400911 RepID=UPI003C0760E3